MIGKGPEEEEQMRGKVWLAMCVLVGLCACGVPAGLAQEAPHKITAQEVAEALADPSANIYYFNASYRAYQDVGPFDEGNQEMRLNGAGFLKMKNHTSILYRAYLPVYATDFPVDDSGLGDALFSAYWVPTKGTFIVGAGGALITPTASETYYGTDKWSAGPTLVVAKKVPGKFTVGGLLTHIWSFAGDEQREAVSVTTIQPAMTYFLGHGTSVVLGSETTCNWQADEDKWQVPLTLAVGQILPPFGKFFLGVSAGGTYYIEKPDYAQEWDVRGLVSIVMP